MRAKPKQTRNTFTPEPLVKQLAKDVAGFKSETPQVQAALASLVWIGATKLRQHTVHDGYMSFHHTELAAQFGGQFKAINARLGFLEVKDTWRWSADGKAADVFTKGYRFSPVVQASREAFLAKRVTRLSKLSRLLDATGTGFRTPPKPVASTDAAGVTTTRWRGANGGDSLSLVPVNIEALRFLQRDLAKKIENFKPEPDPLVQEQRQLEVELLKAKLATEQAQALYYRSMAELNSAKVPTESAKQENLQSDTDLKNLDFVEQESGVNQERDLQKQSHQARNQFELKLMEHREKRKEKKAA